MRNLVDVEFPLGRTSGPTAVMGSIGLDTFITPRKPLDSLVPDGGKYGVSSIADMQRISAEYGIEIQTDEEFPGTSTGNFAVAESMLLGPNEGPVIVFTTLAPRDVTTGKIRKLMRNNNVILHARPHLSGDAKHPAHNPFSWIEQTESDRRIISYKPDDAPPIMVRATRPKPTVLVMGATGGQWEHSVSNGVEYAIREKIPVTVFASESQIRRIETDAAKRSAFLGPRDERGKAIGDGEMTVATAFIGNVEEAKIVVEQAGLHPSRRPADLAKQVKQVGGEVMKVVSLTRGKDGAVLLDPYDNVHTLTVTDIFSRIVGKKTPRLERQRKAFRLGAGDAYGATLVYGLRSLGIDRIAWTMMKAGEAAERVMAYPDAQTGLMTHEQFYDNLRSGFGYSMKAAPSQNFPAPPMPAR